MKLIFGFEYVWEVYKPAAKRIWGYYVCPLLYRGAIVGRIEAHVDQVLVVDRVWWEPSVGGAGSASMLGAFKRCLQRHAEGLGLTGFRVDRSTRIQ